MKKLSMSLLEPPSAPEGHVHEYAHILLPMDEPLSVKFRGLSYEISSRSIGYIPPNVFHHCLCPDEIISINIPEEMIKPRDRQIFDSRAVFPAEGPLSPLVELIKLEVQRDPDSDSLRYLYYYLYDKLAETHMLKSVKYMHDHFSEEIPLKLLADIEHYSVQYFVDWFKKKTGFSPAGYLRRLRMEKARELLSSTHYRLIEIASQVGYDSDASFTRAFKEDQGVTPSAYRKAHLSGRV